MIAGLPGTGIGGLFYILLALISPIVEVYRRRRGDTGPTRISTIAFHLAMVLGIAGTLWLCGIAVIHGYQFLVTSAPEVISRPASGQESVVSSLVPGVALFQVFVLVLLALVLKILSIIIPDPGAPGPVCSIERDGTVEPPG